MIKTKIKNNKPYWNILGNIEIHWNRWYKVIDMQLWGDVIRYSYENLFDGPDVKLSSSRKLKEPDLTEFKKWLSQNHK